jgi:starch-binding outer membrane protein, SusD/RagB family
MKKIKNSISLTLIICLFGTLSCTDILNQEPASITHPAIFWVNQTNAEQGLAGAYGLFKNAITSQASWFYWGELPGMTFMNSRSWISDYIEGSGNYILPYKNDTQDWKRFYRAANWAVTIEAKVNEMPDDLFTSKTEKNRIMGEAAFVRAISYFWLARIWGDVPIVKESIETSGQLITQDGYIARVPRSNELKVLDYSLEAANKAIDLLTYSTPADARWAITANKASAEALKAHITLWYASRDKDNNKMIQESIAATTAVINNSGAALINYVSEGQEGFDKMCIGQSKTGLFEINFSVAQNESYRIANDDGSHTELTLNYPIWKTVNKGGSPYFDPDFYGNNVVASDNDRVDDVRKTLFFNDYASGDEYVAFLLKYSHTSPDVTVKDPYANFSESNILIFRLADMYLLRAEANTRLGNMGAAVADMNLIRSKANVPDYTGTTDRQSLMKAIFDERAIELVGEGHSAYDRIRMDYYYEGVSWMNQSRITRKGYFWPVLPSIISIDPSIVQTEFWKGKL